MPDETAGPSSAIRIDYIEMRMSDVAAAKQFYGNAFGWTFEDYGDAYAAFTDGKTKGGLAKSDSVPKGGVLLVLYATDLAAMQKKIVTAGGKIVGETFAFPGGHRFHFSDPSGNELAVWSDQ